MSRLSKVLGIFNPRLALLLTSLSQIWRKIQSLLQKARKAGRKDSVTITPQTNIYWTNCLAVFKLCSADPSSHSGSLAISTTSSRAALLCWVLNSGSTLKKKRKKLKWHNYVADIYEFCWFNNLPTFQALFKYMYLDLPWGNHPSPALGPHDSRVADHDPWAPWVEYNCWPMKVQHSSSHSDTLGWANDPSQNHTHDCQHHQERGIIFPIVVA